MADNGPVVPRPARFSAFRLASWTLFSPILGDASGVGDAQPLLGDSLDTGSRRISAASRPARSAAETIWARTVSRLCR